MLDPRRVDHFNANWNSFAWLLKWALEQFPPDACRYLEWGSGWSTMYVLTHLKPHNIYSVEDDIAWFNKYKDLGIHIVLRPAPYDHDSPAPTPWRNPYPGERNFAVVLVDGHRRRDECVVTAADLIAPNGFVIVHDTWHAHVHRRAGLKGLECGLKTLVDLQDGPGALLMCRSEYQPAISGLIIGPIRDAGDDVGGERRRTDTCIPTGAPPNALCVRP